LPSKHEETFKKNLFWGTGAWTQDLHLEPLHQPYFCEGFFETLPGLASNLNPSDLCLLNS
jgi:hypothetical protein